MKRIGRATLAAAVTLCVGLLLAAAAASWQVKHNRERAREAFGSLAERVTAEVSARMRIYQFGLRGARGAVASAEGARIGRDAFRRYSTTRDPEREFPGTRGFGVIWRVPQDDEADFVERARRDGWPDFTVRQLAPHAGERFVLEFIEPVEGNQLAIGLDLASEATRRKAALAAMRSGEATLSGPITLVQVTGKPLRSFLLLLPIYRPGAPLATTAQREAAAIGWSFTALVIDEVLNHLDLQSVAGLYRLSLRDKAGADTLAFYSPPGVAATAAPPLQRKIDVSIYGRVWEAELTATPAFIESLALTDPGKVALVVASIAALCATLVMLLLNLLARTRSEHVEQARRAAIVAASDDAIIGATLDGVITDWNGGAERLFGHSVAQALGHRVSDLLVPEDRLIEEHGILEAVGQGCRVPVFDTLRRHRDGTLIDVSVTAVPILTATGRCIGVAKSLRDTRAARAAQRALAALNASLEQQVVDRTARLDTAMHDLRQILDAVPSMIGYWDAQLINRVANHAYGAWFGIPPDEMVGRPLRTMMSDVVFERNRPFIEAALRGEPQTFERATTRSDGGGNRHSLVHYLPDVIESEVRGFYVLVHDVTDLVESRLKLAAAQRATEALLRTVQQHAIVSIADRHGRITEVNDAFCAVSGYTREELIGRDHHVIGSGEQPSAFWRAMWHTVSQGAAWRGEICNRAKDGTLYWVDSLIAPFVDAQGQVEQYIAIRFDITAAKRAEQRLRSSEAFLDRAGQVAGVGGWELDLRSQTLHWSAQTRRIHDVPFDYMPVLATAIDFFAPSARATIQLAVEEGIRDGKPWDVELPFTTATGRSIWVRSVGTAEVENGQVVRLVGALQNITERKQAEATLARERQLMNSLLETLPDQIYFKDRDSRFLRINPALARCYGLEDPARAVGKTEGDFLTPGQAARTEAIERRIVATGEPVIDLEEEEFWPDQRSTWNLTTRMPLIDIDGQIIGTFGISRDITARRQMEADLRISNARMSLAAGTLGLGIWERDLSCGSLSWDERMYGLFGRVPTSHEAPLTVFDACVHPDDRARLEAEMQTAVDGGPPLDTVFRIRLPDGAVRHLKAAAHVDRDATGRALRMTGVNFDVTERVQAELELRGTMTLLNAVLDSATQSSIIAVKPDGLVSMFNVGAQQMLGYAPDEVVGTLGLLDFHDPEDIDQRAQALSAERGHEVTAGQMLVEPEQLGHLQDWCYRRKDGSVLPVSLAVTAMRDPHGELFGYLGIAHDVSRQKAQERELRHAVAKARNASLAKSQFLANMSHEIRTPMNAVIGLSYLLERSRLDAEQMDTLHGITVASKSLLSIINDVLDVSKIEAGEMRIERVPFSPAELMRDIAQMMALQAQEKAIGFALDMPEALPGWVEGDVTRLQQVLNNLLSNAIKFTERGQVRFRVQIVETAQTTVRLRFSCQDSGIGIPADALGRLFTPFVQADETTTRRFGGTGLGLSIVKQLTALMGGTVGVHSELGVGSEFWAELPFLVCEPSQHRASAARSANQGPALRGVRVLVVDDSPINLQVAQRILALEGASVSLASDGQQAVDFLRADPESMDVVLMDVQMPVLDGLDATRRIRDGLGLTALPIIALTAGLSGDERQRVQAAGMNDLVGKPFDPPVLVHCIRHHVEINDQTLEHSAAAPVQTRGAGWPSIDGIDARDVSTRLGGDLVLFASMLQRLLNDFGDLAHAPLTPGALMPVAARLHNLKGSAGTLGAKSLEQLAAHAEEACCADASAQVVLLMRRVTSELDALDRAAKPFLEQTRRASESESRQPPSGALDAEALNKLLTQLEQFDLAAMQSFKSLAAHLRLRMSADAFGALSRNIDDLQFAEAASALQAVVSAQVEQQAVGAD